MLVFLDIVFHKVRYLCASILDLFKYSMWREGRFNINLVAFVDYTAVFCRSNSLEQLRSNMQDVLLYLWFTKIYMVKIP